MFLDAMGCMLTRHPKRDGSLERRVVTPVKMIALLGTSAYADGPLLLLGYNLFGKSSRRNLIDSMRWKPKARVVTRTVILVTPIWRVTISHYTYTVELHNQCHDETTRLQVSPPPPSSVFCVLGVRCAASARAASWVMSNNNADTGQDTGHNTKPSHALDIIPDF